MIDTAVRTAALEPLHAALRARARADADQLCAAAEQDARRTIAEARERAAALLDEARAQGQAEAVAVHAAEQARARRAARGIVLAAQRAAYDELRGRAREAVAALLAEPGNRARLAAVVRARLGEHATVHNHPDGGITADAPGRRSVDASVAALVEGALAELDLELLWAP